MEYVLSKIVHTDPDSTANCNWWSSFLTHLLQRQSPEVTVSQNNPGIVPQPTRMKKNYNSVCATAYNKPLTMTCMSWLQQPLKSAEHGYHSMKFLLAYICKGLRSGGDEGFWVLLLPCGRAGFFQHYLHLTTAEKTIIFTCEESTWLPKFRQPARPKPL